MSKWLCIWASVALYSGNLLASAEDCFQESAYISTVPPDGFDCSDYSSSYNNVNFCMKTWVDDWEMHFSCAPWASDCIDIADAITNGPKDEQLMVKYNGGSGKYDALELISYSDNTCTTLHTASATCRFNLYVDDPITDDSDKSWRTVRADLVDAIHAAAWFIPGSSDTPNSEVEVPFWNDNGAKVNVKARLWYDPADVGCSGACGNSDDYCY